MRKLFPGYYRPTKKQSDEMWREGIFIFDTNVLLNIYRYSPKARDQLFDILRMLQDRIWIPHQVAQEYHSQRLNVISQQFKIYETAENELNNLYKKIKAFKGHPFIDTDKLVSILEEATNNFSSVMGGAKSQHTRLISSDDLMNEIAEIFENNVGQSYTSEELTVIHQEAEQRYTSKQPPGYEDTKKKEGPNKYGDVVLWYQIIAHAQEQQKPIIFVTDDQKDDWWLKHEGIVVGPRPELMNELLEKSNVLFFMYQLDRFMEEALTFLGLKQQPDVVEEVRGIRQQDEQSQQRMQQALAEQENLLWQQTVDARYALDQLMRRASIENQGIEELTQHIEDLERKFQAVQKYLEKMPFDPEKMDERYSFESYIQSEAANLETLRSKLALQLSQYDFTVSRIQALQATLPQYKYISRERSPAAESAPIDRQITFVDRRSEALYGSPGVKTQAELFGNLEQSTSNSSIQRRIWGAQSRQPSQQRVFPTKSAPNSSQRRQAPSHQNQLQRKNEQPTKQAESKPRNPQNLNRPEEKQQDIAYKHKQQTDNDKKRR